MRYRGQIVGHRSSLWSDEGGYWICKRAVIREVIGAMLAQEVGLLVPEWKVLGGKFFSKILHPTSTSISDAGPTDVEKLRLVDRVLGNRDRKDNILVYKGRLVAYDFDRMGAF